MKTQKYFLTILALLILLSSTLTSQNSKKNNILFDVMSPYEDLIEYAINKDDSNVKSTISSLSKKNDRLNNIIRINTLNFLHDNTEKIQSASVSGDYPLIALYAVEIYKSLAEELDVSKLNVPKEIVLLDYVGFKIQVLLKQKNIDWNKISDVAAEGKILWSKIKIKISDRGLQDVMSTVILGIQNAVNSKNIALLEFSAQVDLDLVDLLEKYFEKKSK